MAQLQHYATAVLEAPDVARAIRPNHAQVQLDMEADILDVLQRCATIHLEDKHAESRKNVLLAVGIILLVVGFFTIVAAGQIGIGAAGIAIAVVFFVLRSLVNRKDIEDRKLDVVVGVLARLGPELKLDRPVKVSADFRSYDQMPTVGGIYEQRWLELAFSLADGTGVQLSATLNAKRKEKPKRKYTKIKDRSHEQLDLRFIAPKGKNFPAGLGEKLGTFKKAGPLSVRRAIVKPRYAEFQFQTDPSFREYGRGGWTATGLSSELDGPTAFGAIVAGYKLAAHVEHAS